MRNAILFMALALLLPACAAPATPTPTGTQTPAPLATSEPSPTPTLTPTLEATSPMATSEPVASDFDCKVLSQSIRNGAHFASKEHFDMAWRVRNSGAAAWDPDTVDFTYFSGTRMHLFELAHLQARVEHGEIAALLADMVAPRQTGKYTTFWSLRRGTDYFCRVSLTIIVP